VTRQRAREAAKAGSREISAVLREASPCSTSRAGAAGGRIVTDCPALHRLLRRAFQLSKTLPDELLHRFEQQTTALPKTTGAERLVVQRVGQDLFRHGLLAYWEGRCAITGLAVPKLPRASHVAPRQDPGGRRGLPQAAVDQPQRQPGRPL